MTRILIADDDQYVRRALRALLEEDKEWKVCGEAVDGNDAVHRAIDMKPDLVILDFQMPGMNGLQAAREIVKETPETPVLLCTAHLSNALLGEARRAGFSGAVPKSISSEIVNGVKALLRHESFFSAAV